MKYFKNYSNYKIEYFQKKYLKNTTKNIFKKLVFKYNYILVYSV